MYIKNKHIMLVVLWATVCIYAMDHNIHNNVLLSKGKLAIQCLQATPPQKIASLINRMDPLLKEYICNALTGYKIWKPMLSNLPSEIQMEISWYIEKDAQQFACKFVPDKQAPIKKNDALSSYRQFFNDIPRFVPDEKSSLAIAIDMYTWNPKVHQLYLKNIDGATIPIHKESYRKVQYIAEEYEDYCIASGVMPGCIKILKKSDIQDSQLSYLVSQQIYIDKTGNELYPFLPIYKIQAEYTIDAELDDSSKDLTIYTRSTLLSDSTTSFKRIYQLEPPYMSTTLLESLAHFIAYAIIKENVCIVQNALSYYKQQQVPNEVINKLSALATCDLSYNDNKDLHALCTQKQKIYGILEEIPDLYKNKVMLWPLDVQCLINGWGFRMSIEQKSVSDASSKLPCAIT